MRRGKSVLGPTEAASKLGRSEWQIRALVKSGNLAACRNRLHGRWDIPEEAISQYEAERLREQAQRA